MTSTEQELASFHEFAREQIAMKANGLTLDELFDLWRISHPSKDQQDTNVAAIAASLDDFLNGERGRLAGEHSEELRRRYGILNR